MPLLFLSIAAAVAEPTPLGVNTGLVLAPPEGTKAISISDPRVLGAAAIPGGQYLVQGLGVGTATVTASMTGGSTTSWTYEVLDKPVRGAQPLLVARGRGQVWELDAAPKFIGSGNPQLVHVSSLDQNRRYHLVGIAEKGTEVELLVLWPDGREERRVARVVEGLKDEGRTPISLKSGASHTVDLPSRPTGMAVANGRVVSATVMSGTAGYGLVVNALSPGLTDVVVSIGESDPVLWYTVSVSQ